MLDATLWKTFLCDIIRTSDLHIHFWLVWMILTGFDFVISVNHALTLVTQTPEQLRKSKQCRPWSDCSLGAVWPGSTLFVKHFINIQWIGPNLRHLSEVLGWLKILTRSMVNTGFNRSIMVKYWSLQVHLILVFSGSLRALNLSSTDEYWHWNKKEVILQGILLTNVLIPSLVKFWVMSQASFHCVKAVVITRFRSRQPSAVWTIHHTCHPSCAGVCGIYLW